MQNFPIVISSVNNETFFYNKYEVVCPSKKLVSVSFLLNLCELLYIVAITTGLITN